MASIDCCNNLINPLARFASPFDNGDGLVTANFEFLSYEGGGTQNCGSGVHLTFQKENGTFFGGFTFLEGSDLDVDQPTSNALDWAIIEPFISGNVTNGGAISFQSLDLMKNLGLFNGAVGGDTITLEVGVSILDCVTNELSDNTDNKIVFTEVYEPPVSRLSNHTFIGGASGVFTFDQELKEYDAVTPLAIGDLGRYTVKDAITGEVLEVIEGNYGDPLSSFTQVSNPYGVTSSVTNWITGSFTDGTTLNFAKLDWANANGFTYQNGTLSGGSWVSSAKKLDFCINAYDTSQCSWNDNTDIDLTVDRAVDVIEGSAFSQVLPSGTFFKYSMFDNDGLSENYNEQTSYEYFKDGVLVSSVIPNFVVSSFTWGDRDIDSEVINGHTNASHLINIGFVNGMSATGQSILNGVGRFEFAYNRLLSAPNVKAETFQIREESSALPNVVQRSAFVSNYYHNTTPSSTVDVIQNGVPLYNALPYFNFINGQIGEVDWFDIDLGVIGTRHTLRYETTENGLFNFVNYQIESNFIY